ncbi:MAG: penicillin-binding protein 2 [Proteobacteria bacterium]|nr:penicillin-binding protein 2 [Pseudomonadota bacterium]
MIIARSLYLQVIERPHLEKKAQQQYTRQKTVKLQRGSITDYEGNYLAVSIPLQSIFAIPDEIEDPDLVATLLSPFVKISKENILRKINEKKFFWLQRNAKPQLSNSINQLNLKGVFSQVEYQRFYPQQNHAAQLIGFSGLDSKGLEGIEFRYNKILMEKPRNQPFWLSGYTGLSATQFKGSSIKLTIRSKIQHFAELELTKAIDGMSAKDGVAIIMESQTGKILAMAVQPDYDPNRFSKFENSKFYNRAIGATYEPGSTFKVITLASALESKAISKDNIFNCEEGSYQIHDRTIHDTRPNGWLSLDKIIQKSSNICAAKIGQLITKPVFYKMIRAFGFGEKTGIDLSGEAAGKVHEYQRWTDIDVATLSYGHGISATPLQVLTASNVIATGGMLVRPTVIEEIRKADKSLEERDIVEPKRILSTEVSNLIRDYMTTVTHKGGTGYSARLDGMEVAGKTGTSRKYDRLTGEYSENNHISSFVGFFPAEAPLLTMMIVIDEPQQKYLGVKGATPVFRRIAQHALKYYNKPDLNNHTIKIENGSGAPMFRTPDFVETDHSSKKDKRGSLKKRLLNKTLREVLTIANRENISIEARGSGVVYQVRKKGSGREAYIVKLR